MLNYPPFPIIDIPATGAHIKDLRIQKNLSVKNVQTFFRFESPQAIYAWQKGKSLPTVDNLLALSVLLDTPMDKLLIQKML